MNFISTKLRGVYIIEPTVFGDNRGWFMETYSKGDFDKAGLKYNFVQDNQSFSKEKGILRGVHFQKQPMAQAKLVRCSQGKIMDIAVDFRQGSPTYLQHVAVELSQENKRQLMIPRGFGHGFVTLTDDVMVQYKVDNLYSNECDRSIKFDDPAMNIAWGIDKPITSAKDDNAPLLQDSDVNFTIKVLVTGCNGQLGHDLILRLNKAGYECKGADIADFDITDPAATSDYITGYNPDVVVHCSAYTAVDKAEDDADKCYSVNVLGSENIAKACKAIGAKMCYISTDYVYDENGVTPHEVTDTVNPQSVYGNTKYQGEKKCAEILDKLFVVRTSWVFGINGGNFVKTMLKLGAKMQSLKVVADQIGSPTYTVDLADFLFYIINTEKYGIYNCSNEGFCSWNEFAKAIFKLSNLAVEVAPVSTAEYCSRAARPLNSRLSKQSLKDCGYGVMPTWQDALARYLLELKELEQ